MSHVKPLHTQIIEGDPSKRGKSKLEEMSRHEPQGTRGLGDPPSYLTGPAREMWEFWREELEDMGLDRRPDRGMLEGAVRSYARAIAAEEQVEREGATITESVYYKGVECGTRMRPHPMIRVAEQAWRSVRAFAGRFGLDPESRTKLAMESDQMSHEQAEAELRRVLSMPRPPREPITEQEAYQEAQRQKQNLKTN